MLELKDIAKTYNVGLINETKVLDGFNLSVPKGQFVTVIGSNGSGKTTILNLICGTIFPNSGKIFLEGKDITNMTEFRRARHIGRVFQDTQKGTSPNMTILENLSLADNKGRFYGLSMGVNKKRIDAYKEMLAPLGLGLENKMDVLVGSLSGGQRQVLAMVMCTMTDIDLLILDEHTAALDPKTSELIIELTNKIVREKGITTMMVTHNLRHAVSYGDRLLMFHRGGIEMDLSGEARRNVDVDDLLDRFNQISIESGN
ncbi:MAG: ATP-binding cassette domain-containing protein [Oscillospiraceae bacterium]|nr:ATP-binding cassette domain-containing protein [Oscillospiraceae bacterium]